MQLIFLQPLEHTALRWLPRAGRLVPGALSLLASAVGERWGKGGNFCTSLTVVSVLVTFPVSSNQQCIEDKQHARNRPHLCPQASLLCKQRGRHQLPSQAPQNHQLRLQSHLCCVTTVERLQSKAQL